MGRQQQFAVEKYDVENFVLRHYKERVSATKISQLLLKDKGIKISPLGINRWLKRQRENDIKEKSLQSKEKFEVMVMDYIKEIQDIHEEVKEIKAKAIEEGKLDTYVKLVNTLHKGIELLAKIKGDLQPKHNGKAPDINIIINEINKEAFDKNKVLRNNFHDMKIIDVEAEIINEDKEKEKELRGEQ